MLSFQNTWKQCNILDSNLSDFDISGFQEYLSSQFITFRKGQILVLNKIDNNNVNKTHFMTKFKYKNFGTWPEPPLHFCSQFTE